MRESIHRAEDVLEEVDMYERRNGLNKNNNTDSGFWISPGGRLGFGVPPSSRPQLPDLGCAQGILHTPHRIMRYKTSMLSRVDA
jgi:hypothetical protein